MPARFCLRLSTREMQIPINLCPCRNANGNDAESSSEAFSASKIANSEGQILDRSLICPALARPAHADPLPFPSSPNPNTVCPVLYALFLVVDDVADNALLALALAHNARCRTRNTNHARFCGSTYKDTKRAQLDKQRQ